jgi:Holliday junction resolvasome RuvABC endonuclease subunit
MKLVLGCDPGLTGALAIISTTANDTAVLISAIDVPTIGAGTRHAVDVIAVQEWLLQHGPTQAVIEAAQAYPGQGVSSTFKYGVSYGALQSVIALCGIPVEFVAPGVWKRALRLGKEKEVARQRVLELFPRAHATFSRRRDHNKAEACLLAVCGARQHFPLGPSAAAPTEANVGSINEYPASMESQNE